MADWIEITGSPEQIEEMRNAKDGFIFRDNFREWTVIYNKMNNLKPFLDNHKDGEYLICNPHPLAEMICQQARTGQPVWIKLSLQEFARVCRAIEYAIKVCFYTDENCEVTHPTGDIYIVKTSSPIWGFPGAQYSFTPFED